MDDKSDTDPIFIKQIGGKRLEIRIDIPCMQRLRRLDPPIDIRKLIDPVNPENGLFERMRDDPSIAIDIAFEASRNEDNKDETGLQFAEGLYGDAIAQYTEAVIDSIVRFIPDRKTRETMRLIVVKTKAGEDKVADTVLARINSGMIETKIDQEIQLAFKTIDSTQSESIDESLSFAESSPETQEDPTRSES